MTAHLDFIGIVVTDMSATLAFYRRLGLNFPDGADGEQHVETELGGGMRLAFDTEAVVRSFHPGYRPPVSPGRIGLAFRCSSPAEVDARYAELTGAGYTGELKPWDAVWGQRYATVNDPDGNGIDLYAPLPS